MDHAAGASEPRDAATLRATCERLEIAFENLAQGVCFYDGAKRLVTCNRRYAELYGLDPAALQPGVTLGEVVAMRAAIGTGPRARPDDYLSWRLNLARKKAAHVSTIELNNGRFIAIKHQPMGDGGWVATHEDVTAQHETAARVAHLAHHDALTGLPNRTRLRERLDEAFAAVERQGGFAMLCLDLDRFKEVNDTLGHPVGDQLLRAVTGRLQAAIRDGDTVARLGGDEFAIVQSPVGSAQNVAGLARRILDSLTAPFDLAGDRVLVGCSIGVALAPQDGATPDTLLQHADIALYRAKADGRGCWRFFEPEMNQRMQMRRNLEQDLRRALDGGQFALAYQPWVAVEDGTVLGVEALLRWNHPERGQVSPDTFIPLAEETALIVPIGSWILEQACRDAAALDSQVKLAVNLSPVQFARHNLDRTIETALARSGLDPTRLELEITERVMLQDTEATLGTLHRLRALGVGIAMDDFGTGYSSLAALQRFPFTKVKIDRRFTENLAGSRQAAAIVKAIVDLAHALGMRTTAEGVESAAQLDALRACGCIEAQGHLCGRAVPFGALPGLLERARAGSAAALQPAG